MPDYRMYWRDRTRYPPIADVFTRKRFDELKSFFHNANNRESSDFDPYDRVFKFRQLFELYLKNCQELPVDECLSINKQTKSYKGKQTKM